MAHNKKILQTALNWTLVIAAWGYLIYKLVTYDNYAALTEQFRHAGTYEWLCLIVSFCLFPVNRLLEAWKWQYLVRHIEPMGILEAQRQVYFGAVAGFITPYKLGEYPARTLLFHHTQQNWLSAVVLGLIGGYAMTTVIVLLGLPSAVKSVSNIDLSTSIGATLLLAAALLIGLPWVMNRLSKRTWKNQKTQLLVQQLGRLNAADIIMVLFISLLRYACFLLQLWLCMRFCSIELSAGDWLNSLLLYYLLITVTPSVPLAEVAVRGSWAIAVFGVYGKQVTAAATIAAILLWFINTIPPVIIGGLIKTPSSEQHKNN